MTADLAIGFVGNASLDSISNIGVLFLIKLGWNGDLQLAIFIEHSRVFFCLFAVVVAFGITASAFFIISQIAVAPAFLASFLRKHIQAAVSTLPVDDPFHLGVHDRLAKIVFGLNHCVDRLSFEYARHSGADADFVFRFLVFLDRKAAALGVVLAGADLNVVITERSIRRN